MDLLLQGLTLSLSGLAITFASLGILILIIIVLNRVFAPSPAPPDETSASTRPADENNAAPLDSAIVAAMAAALAKSIRSQDYGLGDALSAGAGPWWRPQMMESPPARPGRTRGAD